MYCITLVSWTVLDDCAAAACLPFLLQSKTASAHNNKTSIKFTLEDHSGALSDALAMFARHGINLSRIESRPSKRTNDFDFYVDCLVSASDPKLQQALAALREKATNVSVVASKKVAWFPRRMRDLDLVANDILSAGAELESDHPGFHDPAYRKRRAELAQVAKEYRTGDRIPRVNYTKEETATWTQVWDHLMPLVEKHACSEHVRMIPLLMENCGYRRDNIPQLQDISDFLKDSTGFTIRPVAGLLSARNFLYGLAFRVFFSTQYIRHHSKPLYTPEPDICHELLGHVPLLADKHFADFSQEIGLAAIGASDEQITKLARCYWFSVEFGLCYQNGERKAYGAGLLSSYGELEYSMSEKPEIRPWDPFSAGEQDYPITTYQPVYYMAESFEQAKESMQRYSSSFKREFYPRYDPYSQTIDVDANIETEAPKVTV